VSPAPLRQDGLGREQLQNWSLTTLDYEDFKRSQEYVDHGYDLKRCCSGLVRERPMQWLGALLVVLAGGCKGLSEIYAIPTE